MEKDGRMVPIRFFGTMRKEDIALNEYVVTNQWVYPQADGGKRLDIVLLINGFPHCDWRTEDACPQCHYMA